MIVDVPAAMAFQTPVPLPIVATEVVPLSHVPEPTALESVPEPDIHKTDVPLKAPGLAFTVTTWVTEFPPKV